jgi:hypothetical protein
MTISSPTPRILYQSAGNCPYADNVVCEGKMHIQIRILCGIHNLCYPQYQNGSLLLITNVLGPVDLIRR